MTESETLDFQVDIDEFTLGEIDELEQAFGCKLEEIDLERAKALVWMVYLTKRRKDPKYTLEQARAIKVSALPQPEEPAKRPTRARKGKGKNGSGPRT